jgi:hypothetical protein
MNSQRVPGQLAQRREHDAVPKRTGAVGVVAPESLFFQEFKQRRDQRDVLPRLNLVHRVKQVRAGVVVQQRLVLGLVEEREERRGGGVGGELVDD